MSLRKPKKVHKSSKFLAEAVREGRLAEALRANLGRRKKQERVRQGAVDADQTGKK